MLPSLFIRPWSGPSRLGCQLSWSNDGRVHHGNDLFQLCGVSFLSSLIIAGMFRATGPRDEVFGVHTGPRPAVCSANVCKDRGRCASPSGHAAQRRERSHRVRKSRPRFYALRLKFITEDSGCAVGEPWQTGRELSSLVLIAGVRAPWGWGWMSFPAGALLVRQTLIPTRWTSRSHFVNTPWPRHSAGGVTVWV